MKITNKHWVLADQVVVSGSAFATNLLLAKALGIASYGIFSAVLLYQLLVLGLLQAAFSGLVPVLLAHLDGSRHRRYTSGLFWLHQAIITLLFLLCVLLCRLLPMQLDTPLWLAAASGGLAYCMHDYLRKWMLSTQKVKHAVVLDLIANVPQLFLLVFFYWQGSLKLVNALWVVALTFLPAVFFGIIWLKPGRPVFANMKDAGAVHWPHARWTLSSAFLQWSAGNYFVLAAGWWLGNAALGALRLAQYMFGLLNVLLQALEHYALPKAAQLQHDRKALFLFLRRQVMQAALAILPVVALMVLGRNYLMQFSGGQAFTPYSFVFAGLGVLYCIIILGYGVRLAMRALLLNKFYFIGYLLSTIFSVSSARFLVSHYELGGIMAGMVMAQLILVVFWMFCLIQKNNLTWKSFTWYLAK